MPQSNFLMQMFTYLLILHTWPSYVMCNYTDKKEDGFKVKCLCNFNNYWARSIPSASGSLFILMDFFHLNKEIWILYDLFATPW